MAFANTFIQQTEDLNLMHINRSYVNKFNSTDAQKMPWDLTFNITTDWDWVEKTKINISYFGRQISESPNF